MIGPELSRNRMMQEPPGEVSKELSEEASKGAR